MGTPFAPGQLQKLQTIVNIGIATVLPKVAEKYDPKVVLRALDGRGEIFASHLETALAQAVNNMLVLAPKGDGGVTLYERHDPDAFYRTREGLYVWDDYRNLVVAKAKPSAAGTVFKFERADLMQDMSDEGIEGALPKSHLFNETQACGLIATLIALQPDGKADVLLNNGYANLFYLASCVVLVFWSADNRKWGVDTYKRDDRRWSAGAQVFSPAN